MIRCPHSGCSFSVERPGELKHHEVVHEPWWNEVPDEATKRENAQNARAALEMFERLQTERRDREEQERNAKLASAWGPAA